MEVQVADAFEHLFTNKKRYRIYFGGRGGAKSWAFAQALLIKGARNTLRILCAREFQGSIRDSVHKLLSDTIIRQNMESFYEVQNQSIKGQNGTSITFIGLQNTSQLKSMEKIDIVWLEEAENISERSWDIIIPTIRAPGSEIWCSFNPQTELDATYARFVEPHLEAIDDKGWYEDDHMYVRKTGWRENPWFPDELKEEMLRCKRDDPIKYEHIWEGNVKAAVEGAIYGNQLEVADRDSRITSVPYDSSLPVHTAWDLGVNDTTAIVMFQSIGKEIRVIDCYEGRLQGLDHYARVLKEKEYYYGDHYLPHDIGVTELSTNRTRLEVLEGLGVRPIEIVPRVAYINEGIEQTRQMFSRVWFDREKAADLLAALRNYQYTWDEKFNVFRQKPLHNHASNYADAFRQIAQGFTDTPWSGYKSDNIDMSRFEARAPR